MKKDERKEYMDRLRKLRIDAGLSQREVGAYLGTTQAMYAHYEACDNEMPIRHLYALCMLYKVSADSVLGLDV